MRNLRTEAEEAIRSVFPNRLAELLQGRNLREVERQTGISRQFINKLKNGRSLPSAATLLTLSWYLEVPLQDLIDPQPIGDLLEALAPAAIDRPQGP